MDESVAKSTLLVVGNVDVLRRNVVDELCMVVVDVVDIVVGILTFS